MTARKGHACRTKLETEICDEMGRQRVPHEHRSLRFRIDEAEGRLSKYVPALVARRGTILFLVEPISAPGRDSVKRLTRFLEQHSPELVLVVVTRDSSVPRFPSEAYDEIYPASEIPRAIERIRRQNPEGVVLPFEKVRVRDTVK